MLRGGRGPRRRRRAPQLLCIDASSRWRSPLGAGRAGQAARPGPGRAGGPEPEPPQPAAVRAAARALLDGAAPGPARVCGALFPAAPRGFSKFTRTLPSPQKKNTLLNSPNRTAGTCGSSSLPRYRRPSAGCREGAAGGCSLSRGGGLGRGSRLGARTLLSRAERAPISPPPDIPRKRGATEWSAAM